MKTHPLLLLTCVLLTISISCQDNLPNVDPSLTIKTDSTLSIEAAQQIYSNYLEQKSLARTTGVKEKDAFEKRLQWQYAQTENFANGSPVVLIPLDPKVNNYSHGTMSLTSQTAKKPESFAEIFTTRKAVIYRREGKDQVEFMSIIGEQSYKKQATFFDTGADFTGVIVFQDDNGAFLRGFYYKKGQTTGTLQNSESIKNESSKNARRSCSIYAQNVYVNFYYEVVVNGVSYGRNYNFTDVQTTFSVNCPPENPGYQPTNYTGSSNDDWVKNSANSVASNYVVYAPGIRIDNIIKHLKCFSNVADSRYRIFMNVDQPSAGSESPINPLANNKHVVGHAYLTFQQIQTDNQIITRTVGFYPVESGGNPTNPSASPAYGDDSHYENGWDVQVQFAVTGAEFMQALDVVKQYGNQNYNLMNRSCGNMCVDALQQAGITISSSWMNQYWGTSSPGTGAPVTSTSYGPSIGALGQQLYNVQSSKVVSQSHSGGVPIANQGSCN